MANNRLFVACPVCKTWRLVAKNWGGPEWSEWDNNGDIARFISDHMGDCRACAAFYVEHIDSMHTCGLPALPADFTPEEL